MNRLVLVLSIALAASASAAAAQQPAAKPAAAKAAPARKGSANPGTAKPNPASPNGAAITYKTPNYVAGGGGGGTTNGNGVKGQVGGFVGIRFGAGGQSGQPKTGAAQVNTSTGTAKGSGN